MKLYIPVLILILFPSFAECQTRKSEDRKREEQFTFIESKFDSTLLEYFRTFQCISKKGDDISSLLRAIRIQAVNLGANCFKLKSFSHNDSTDQLILTLDTYFASESQLQLNSEMHEKNVIYIISDDKFSDKNYTFHLNGEKIILKSGYYYKHYLQEGEEAKINKGGITGSTLLVKWDESNPGVFITMTGFAFADASPIPSKETSIGFTTGKIHYLTTNLGLLLSNTLQLSK